MSLTQAVLNKSSKGSIRDTPHTPGVHPLHTRAGQHCTPGRANIKDKTT